MATLDKETKTGLWVVLGMLLLVVLVGVVSGCGASSEEAFVPPTQTFDMSSNDRPACLPEVCQDRNIDNWCKLDKTHPTCPTLTETLGVSPVAGWVREVKKVACGTFVIYTDPSTKETTTEMFYGENLVGVVQQVSFGGACKQSFWGKNLFCCY